MSVASLVAGGLLVSFHRQRYLLSLDSHPKAEEFAASIATLQAHSWWVNGRPRPL